VKIKLLLIIIKMIDKCLLISSLISIISVLIYSFINNNNNKNKYNENKTNYLFLGCVIFIVSFIILYISLNQNKSQNISVSDVPKSFANNKPPF
jgi:hypothetical protein